MHEAQRLSSLSRAIRFSSLKRLRQVPDRQVPEGQENWRPSLEAMSFADLAHHLIEADRWLFRKLRAPDLTGMVGEAGEAGQVDRTMYLELLGELERLGEERAAWLSQLTDGALDETIPDDRFGGMVSAWWVIVRGNLDHEAHHRGQVAAYLRAVSSQEQGYDRPGR